MISLLQRVTQAEVEVAGAVVGRIGPGLLVLRGWSTRPDLLDTVAARRAAGRPTVVDLSADDFDAEGNPLEEGESDRVKAEHEREHPGRTDEEAEKEAEAEAEREQAEEAVEEAEEVRA